MFRNKTYIVPAAVFLLTALILCARAPERIAHGFLWAEDAAIFMVQAGLPLHTTIKTDYAGYLHLLPRVIAWVQNRTVDVSRAPYFFAWASLLITAASSAYIAAAIRVIPAAGRVAMALAPVLAPQNGEVLLTITNLQWLLFPSLLVLLWECLFYPPESGYAARVVATVALALTGPFGVFVAPVVAIVVIVRRRGLAPRRAIWIAAYAGAVAVQTYVMIAHPWPHPPPGYIDWPTKLLREVFCDLLPGQPPLWAGAFVAALLGYAIVSTRQALASVLICGLGISIWGLAVNRVNAFAPVLSWQGAGGRYLYLAFVFFLWISVLAVVNSRGKTGVVAGLVLAGVVLSANLTRFEVFRTPDWRVVATDGGYDLQVPPGWTVKLPYR